MLFAAEEGVQLDYQVVDLFSGDQVTIADYFGAPMITLGEVIGCDYAPYANVTRWLGNMNALKSWSKVNETFYGLVNSMGNNVFQAL